MVARTAAPAAAFAKLSNDAAIQFILADIPLFTVGILAFGVLTFFFLMKRVDKWVFCLHVSALLAFLAALFDLSQILIRGRQATDQGLDTGGVSGLVTAREVFYAFANGLRFLFYWGFVATIPLGETMPVGTTMHSGSWRRWGILGILLKWSTLLLVILSTILQLVYRDVKVFEKISAVYEAESTLEIIVSAVFILKLLLNTWARFPAASTVPSRGTMLIQYAPVIVCLMFSLWIAVGNVILFEFTETALGRFLRAIELYILIVYMLTISFHHLRHLSFFPIYRPATKGPSRAATFQRDSIAKANDEMPAAASPPGPPAPVRVDLLQVLEEQFRQQEMPPTVTRDSSRAATIENVSQHQSMAARLSTWLGVARPLPRPPQQAQVVQPWDVDSERGPSPVAQEFPVQSWYADEKARVESPPLPAPPAIDADEQRGVSPVPDYAPNSEVVERDIASSAPRSAGEYPPAPGIIVPEEGEITPVPERDWRDIEYSNAVRYSGVGDDVLAAALRQQNYQRPQDGARVQPSDLLSPVPSRPGSVDAGYLGSPYPMSPIGSAAVTPLPRSRPLPPMPRPDSTLLSPSSPLPPDSARSSNMSILLRRQTELDESIAALRLFSPSKMAFDMSSMPVQPSMFYSSLLQPASGGERLSTVPSMESPELPAPSPDLTLATPRADREPQSSAKSEFSFSNFQHQPPLNRGSMDSAVIPATGIAVEPPSEAGDGDGRSRAETPVSQLEPPRMPAAMGSRFSDVSSVGDGRERKFDSLGTQYEITSFIGNLTVPASNKDSAISASSAAASEEGSVSVAVATKADLSTVEYARPTLVLPPSNQSETVLDGLTAPHQPSSMGSPIHTPSGGRRALPPVPQPSARSPSPPQSPPPAQPPQQRTQAAPRFRRAVGLPPRPRLEVVNVTPSEGKLSPSDTASTLVSSPPAAGSGTPPFGKQ
ncbi:hypothetical protein BV20DRAFT_935787 [Pilatotrama ljubarskyi]|nr:hypothetical protein BV20DRAFT_935787 [Pilatotrama ljubarskyi]